MKKKNNEEETYWCFDGCGRKVLKTEAKKQFWVIDDIYNTSVCPYCTLGEEEGISKLLIYNGENPIKNCLSFGFSNDELYLLITNFAQDIVEDKTNSIISLKSEQLTKLIVDLIAIKEYMEKFNE